MGLDDAICVGFEVSSCCTYGLVGRKCCLWVHLLDFDCDLIQLNCQLIQFAGVSVCDGSFLGTRFLALAILLEVALLATVETSDSR